MARKYPNNYLHYPKNIFPPRKVTVGGKEWTLYAASFRNLYNLYDYLKSDPEVNGIVFRNLQSEENPESQSGKPYKEALEDLIKPGDKKYSEFLRLDKSISGATKGNSRSYETVMSVQGGYLNVPAYIAGDPLCYESIEPIKKSKFIKMNVLISYNGLTQPSQVTNRAIIIANLIKALESYGYSVDLNAFELSTVFNEIECITVNIKNHGEAMKMTDLYKVLCNIEFFRRLLFRVIETLDVKECWSQGYGHKCSKEFTKEFFNMGENDLYLDQPSKMGIRGYSLADDFESVVDYLNLRDKIDVEKAKEDFRNEDLKLKRSMK